MKKVLLSICTVLLFTYTASAQFHIELGPNFNMPQGDFGDAYDLGIGFYIEPKYAMSDNIDIGLVIGSNGFAGADFGGASYGATSALVILPTATYRFSTNSVTPYAGLGLGLYSFKGAEVTSGTVTLEGESESKFGFAPRAGVYIGRLNLGAAYNIVSDANYIQFNLGVRILSRD
ncbi:outer membrane beta-barrel protein [Ekhidna sp.]|uniref:outer membrane beta-barrel protein n=1 Tax=Ekhidna sp. TaxID=2608089 RepID=UPI003298665A